MNAMFADGPHALKIETPPSDGAGAQPAFRGRIYAKTESPDGTGTVEETSLRCVIPPHIRVADGDILRCLTGGAFEGRYRVTSVVTATARQDPHHQVLSLVKLPVHQEAEEETGST